MVKHVVPSQSQIACKNTLSCRIYSLHNTVLWKTFIISEEWSHGNSFGSESTGGWLSFMGPAAESKYYQWLITSGTADGTHLFYKGWFGALNSITPSLLGRCSLPAWEHAAVPIGVRTHPISLDKYAQCLCIRVLWPWALFQITGVGPEFCTLDEPKGLCLQTCISMAN